MIQIVYTNSNCSDIWEMFITQNKKNCNIPLFFISDKQIDNIDPNNIFIYKNSDQYYQVWCDALTKFNCNNFIYLQEDFILYDKVNIEKIHDYLNYLNNNSEYSFIRLLKSGDVDNQITETLFEINSLNTNLFAMQATIWKTNEFMKIMNNVKEPKWLETVKYNEYMSTNNIKGLTHFNYEPKRGLAHHDSDVYPYIATALVKGKWIYSEYSNELDTLLKTYNINKHIRGII